MTEPSQTSRGRPRRPHHKSRTGCLQCKQRKVKCDEEKPICKKCQLYGTSCSFLQTHPLQRPPPPPTTQVLTPPQPNSPSRQPTIQSMLTPDGGTSSLSSPSHPPISPAFSSTSTNYLTSTPDSSTSTFTMLDLELLHFYTTVSIHDFLDTDTYMRLFGNQVVRLAFRFPFLMHEVLSVSALHLSHLRPDQKSLYQHASDAHAAMGLQLYQPQIARLTYKNCDACFAFSTWIWVHAWAAQDLEKPSSIFFSPSKKDNNNNSDQEGDGEEGYIKWIALHRGTNSIIETLWPVLKSGPLGGIFDPWVALDPNRPDPLTPEEESVLSALPQIWKSPHPSYPTLSPTEIAALEKALAKLRRTYSMLTLNTNISRIAIVMAWFSAVPDEYLAMLERKVPQAIVLAMYFCPTLKRFEGLWWMEGKDRNLLGTLCEEVGEGWEEWVRWPRMKVFGEA